MDQQVLLHVSDWNYKDKYYQLPLSMLHSFGRLILAQGISKAWGWFVTQVDYGGDPDLLIKRCDNEADHTLDEYFLDYTHPEESVSEWELED